MASRQVEQQDRGAGRLMTHLLSTPLPPGIFTLFLWAFWHSHASILFLWCYLHALLHLPQEDNTLSSCQAQVSPCTHVYTHWDRCTIMESILAIEANGAKSLTNSTPLEQLALVRWSHFTEVTLGFHTGSEAAQRSRCHPELARLLVSTLPGDSKLLPYFEVVW